MEVKNPLYKNQGIHVIASIFTIDKSILKVLLIKRKNNPFKDMWSLVGGALYNNETIEEGINREVKEKIGIKIPSLEMYDVFSDIDRSPLMRMIGIGYIGLIDSNKVIILKETLKTLDSEWYPLYKIPSLAYDHNKILDKAVLVLKDKIINTDILKILYPNGFALPEIQKLYESVLNKELDRRNFRKKMLGLNLIYDTGKTAKFEGNKPAKLYKFNQKNDKIF